MILAYQQRHASESVFFDMWATKFDVIRLIYIMTYSVCVVIACEDIISCVNDIYLSYMTCTGLVLSLDEECL